MSAEKKQTEGNLQVLEGGQVPKLDIPDNTDDEEIDLLDLFYYLMDRLHILVLCFLIGAVLLNAYSYFFIKPTYQSTAKMYIVSASKDSVIDISDLNVGTSLTQDYEQLIKSYPVMDEVSEKLGLNMKFEDLAKMITLENPADTRILNITVTSTDPQQAMDIANTTAKVAKKYLPKTMSSNPPNIAQEARLADHKAGPSYFKYTVIGALIGLVLAVAFFAFQYMADDTIHSAEDLEKYFGLVPLTTIPESDVLDDSQTRKRRSSSLFKRLMRKK